MVDRLVSDLISTTRDRLERSGVASVDEVRRFGEQLVRLSGDVRDANATLKAFLRENLYHHQRIEKTKEMSGRILRELFVRYMHDDSLLPADARLRAAREGLPRVVADHIAGMTDRYASDEYRRLVGSADQS